mmetsp:Transcript_37466/g.69285  ORF Transcript_37466/g.69285 Transcript_37466/m.69285 type:complete len:376 (+) Transcript_37466:1717-2844(+)
MGAVRAVGDGPGGGLEWGYISTIGGGEEGLAALLFFLGRAPAETQFFPAAALFNDSRVVFDFRQRLMQALCLLAPRCEVPSGLVQLSLQQAVPLRRLGQIRRPGFLYPGSFLPEPLRVLPRPLSLPLQLARHGRPLHLRRGRPCPQRPLLLLAFLRLPPPELCAPPFPAQPFLCLPLLRHSLRTTLLRFRRRLSRLVRHRRVPVVRCARLGGLDGLLCHLDGPGRLGAGSLELGTELREGLVQFLDDLLVEALREGRHIGAGVAVVVVAIAVRIVAIVVAGGGPAIAVTFATQACGLAVVVMVVVVQVPTVRPDRIEAIPRRAVEGLVGRRGRCRRSDGGPALPLVPLDVVPQEVRLVLVLVPPPDAGEVLQGSV